MAEYIDREALISKIVNTPFWVNCTGETEDYRDGMLDGLVKKQHNVLDMIQKQPAADVVEVVRCKACIHAEPHPSLSKLRVCGKFKFGKKRLWMPDDGYCCAGERREDND